MIDRVQVSGDGATAGTGSAAGAAGGAAIVMANSAMESVP